MSNVAEQSAGNTSSYFPFYQALFEAVDVSSAIWQPVLNAIGRSQLDFAGLQARQAQAVLHWAHQIVQPASPLDLFNANAQLWRTMTEQYMEAMPRFAAAVSTATEAVAPTIRPAPARRPRDTLVLLDREEEATPALERKVA
jgi:hypothetical protein